MPSFSPFSRACLALAICQSINLPTQAATITVNNKGDMSSGCTLRDAMESLRSPPSLKPDCSNTGEPLGIDDTIIFDNTVFPSDGSVTITLVQTTPLYINSDITINGPGQAALTISGLDIDGNGVFSTVSTTKLNINNLTIFHGTAPNGGGVRFSDGTLRMSHVTISDCSASTSGGGLYFEGGYLFLENVMVSGGNAQKGGGLFAQNGIMSLDNVTVSDNSADNNGGGIYVENANLEINNSSIFGNHAGIDGGGIYTQDISWEINNTTVSGNSAENNGGGIFIENGTGETNNTTVSGNRASGNGGGIFTYDAWLIPTNSTVSANEGTIGGGIAFAADAVALITNSTISNNTATALGGGIFSYSADSSRPSVSLSNSIVAGNTADTADEIGGLAADFSTNNANLFGHAGISQADALSNFIPGDGDIVATSDSLSSTSLTSILGPLQDNGGSIETHALVMKSPAIDAADNAICPATDQRGEPRDKKCDIGAFEFIDGEACYVINSASSKTIVFCL